MYVLYLFWSTNDKVPAGSTWPLLRCLITLIFRARIGRGKTLACHLCGPGSIPGISVLEGSGRLSKVDSFLWVP